MRHSFLFAKRFPFLCQKVEFEFHILRVCSVVIFRFSHSVASRMRRPSSQQKKNAAREANSLSAAVSAYRLSHMLPHVTQQTPRIDDKKGKVEKIKIFMRKYWAQRKSENSCTIFIFLRSVWWNSWIFPINVDIFTGWWELVRGWNWMKNEKKYINKFRLLKKWNKLKKFDKLDKQHNFNWMNKKNKKVSYAK